MSLFDDLVEGCLKERPDLVTLRTVVEKEILHHDILRIMNRGGLLRHLVFIGGTCLRLCHGSPRLSENLDFATSLPSERLRSELSGLGSMICEQLMEKYGLPVTVEPPVPAGEHVSTWRVRVITRPERRDLPLQRINIDIQTIPSYDFEPTVLRNPYRIDLGTLGMILMAEARAEILAGKVVAIALRPNRVKSRDLWDIAWLDQQGVSYEHDVLMSKLAARQITEAVFRDRYHERCRDLQDGRNDFTFEMVRFLPPGQPRDSVSTPEFWTYLLNKLRSLV